MPTLVSPDQRLQLNAALAVIQWKHAFTVRMRQRTNAPSPVAKTDNRNSKQPILTVATKKLFRTY